MNDVTYRFVFFGSNMDHGIMAECQLQVIQPSHVPEHDTIHRLFGAAPAQHARTLSMTPYNTDTLRLPTMHVP